MLCRECHTFRGEPYCGSCRALTRVKVLLTGGHFRQDQEAAVLRILRDTSGVLQDLAEANRGCGSSKEPVRTTPEEKGAPKESPEIEREKKEKKEDKEDKRELPAEEAAPEVASSYIEESEEEELREEEIPVEPVRPAIPLPEPRGSLGRAIGLNPTGKASAAASRAASLKRADHHQHQRRHHERRHRTERSRHEEGTREKKSRDRDRRPGGPEPPHHPPAHFQGQRKRERSRSRHKKSKGKAKRERGRAWREANFRRPY